MSRKAFLILEDGTEFEGKIFGYETETTGEAVFNTSMSGYQEILTDPSCCGQIVTMTYPMIGNYGVNSEDVESDKIQVSGFVVKEYCRNYSNFRANGSLADYLKDGKISAIEGIDTRQLTRYIREKGTMRAGIFFDKKEAIEKLKASPQMPGLDLASQVSCRDKYAFGEKISQAPEIAVFDFGVKTSILRLLKNAGFNVTVYPGSTPIEEAVAQGAKGVILSNGPGDPDVVKYGNKLVKDIIKEEIPCFGICLGHLLMGLGFGGKTYQLKSGHRGENQPVMNLRTNKVEITSQNHGFSLDINSLKGISDIEITHINLNDKTCEGLRHKKLPLFSMQYLSESAPGPDDSGHLFDEFKKLVS